MGGPGSYRSSVVELATSPTSIISCGRDYLTDKELVLRWKLLDAQRQRGKIAQNRYETKQKDLLRLCSNDDFRDLVLQSNARLVEGEIDHAGYDKRVRFLVDKIGYTTPLAQALEQYEADLKAKERQDKLSRRRTLDDLHIPRDLKKTPSLEQRSPEEERLSASEADSWSFETTPRPRRRSSAGSRRSKSFEKISFEPSSPEEKKFFASEAEQGWTFDTAPAPRPRRRSSVDSQSSKVSFEPSTPDEKKFFASDADQGWTFETAPRPRRRSSVDSQLSKDSDHASTFEPRSPEEEKFFLSDAEQGWTFETAPRKRTRSSDSTGSASCTLADYSRGSDHVPAGDGQDHNGMFQYEPPMVQT